MRVFSLFCFVFVFLTVNGQINNPGLQPKYCNEVINSTYRFDQVKDTELSAVFINSYKLSYSGKDFPDELNCEISEDHGLPITLKQITKIKRVDLNPFLPRVGILAEIKISLRLGLKVVQKCLPVKERETFDCLDKDGTAKSASAIEITSETHWSVSSLAHLLAGIRIEKDEDADQDHSFKETATTEINSEESDSKYCPQITPYRGMLEEYKDYKLTLDGRINQLLKLLPCRNGFYSNDDKDDINQCVKGTWQGKGFPVCNEIEPVTPPDVDGCQWDFPEETHQEIVYTCEDGRNTTAMYSIENRTWIGVPTPAPDNGGLANGTNSDESKNQKAADNPDLASTTDFLNKFGITEIIVIIGIGIGIIGIGIGIIGIRLVIRIEKGIRIYSGHKQKESIETEESTAQTEPAAQNETPENQPKKNSPPRNQAQGRYRVQ